MTAVSSLSGYVLEEVLAWLLQASGYELLASEDQDSDELKDAAAGLAVRGRGTEHQVDVLGEFRFTPAFSLPVRMFLEAKHFSKPVQLKDVRNLVGILRDINDKDTNTGQHPALKRRYHYVCSLFSAAGFTEPAQEYAIAHQISLIDLSGPSFVDLRRIVKDAAMELDDVGGSSSITVGPKLVRQQARQVLGTAPDSGEPENTDPAVTAAVAEIFTWVRSRLDRPKGKRMIMGFPHSPLMLGMQPHDIQAFLTHARRRPAHPVRLKRVGSRPVGANWVIYPSEYPDAYALAFGLPDRIEQWIDEDAERRAVQAKRALLQQITVYYVDHDRPEVFHLSYEPRQFREQRHAQPTA